MFTTFSVSYPESLRSFISRGEVGIWFCRFGINFKPREGRHTITHSAMLIGLNISKLHPTLQIFYPFQLFFINCPVLHLKLAYPQCFGCFGHKLEMDLYCRPLLCVPHGWPSLDLDSKPTPISMARTRSNIQKQANASISPYRTNTPRSRAPGR